jgi:phosphatidylglycerophosphate synthase
MLPRAAGSGRVSAIRFAIWIDATPPESALRVFGMSLVERLLAAVAQLAGAKNARFALASVVVEHAPAAAPRLRADLAARLGATLAEARGTLSERIARAAARDANAVLLALPGDAIVDTRVLAELLREADSAIALADEGARRTALVRLAAGAVPAPASANELRGFAEAQRAAGTARVLPLSAIAEHIADLRRDQPAYAFRLAASEVASTERWLFWSNYKGSTDFLTRFVFPPFVWAAVRPLARLGVHPNWVTGLAVLLCFGAIPLWAHGHWALGFAAAYGMAVLDSVDGKLARLTFTASTLGNVMDHGTDILHPPFWYAAWAWGLAGGPHGPVYELTLWMFGLYTLDRLVAPIFRAMTQKSIHGYAPIDVAMRTFISRRNVNLPVFTVALPLGLGAEAIVLVVAWQAACFVFHAVRCAQVAISLERSASRAAR